MDLESHDGWSLFDQAPGALVLADDELTLTRVNPACARLLGRDAATLVGRNAFGLMRPEEREGARERLAALREDGRPYAVDQCFSQEGGSDVWLRVLVGRVRDGSRRCFMASVEDTTEHRRTTARLQRLAERDHLTGLLNRRRLEEELEAVLAGVRRYGRQGCLVLVDLDHFKAVNDREGHEAGDRVLSFVAATLATRVRGEDAVARIGGDEFAVLLRDTTLQAAEGVAAEIVALISGAGYSRVRGVTASAGVAALSADTRNAQDALHAADLAMYTAKAAGRDRVAVHGPSSGPAAPGAEPRSVTLAPAAAGQGTEPVRSGELQAVADAPSVAHALQAARELLGLDLAYVTQHTDAEQVLLAVEGDAASFGVGPGTRTPLAEILCQLVLDGRIGSVLPDVTAVPEAAALAVTEAAALGAFATVPVRLSDGTLFGTLCAAGHEAAPQLGPRDAQVLVVLARGLAGALERDAALRAQLDLRVQAAGAEALLSAIEARDRYTGTHSREVVALATAVAVAMELPPAEQLQVSQLALLHDIGKLALPDAILSKPGPLSHDETVVMRRHPEDGARIVAAIPGLAHLAGPIRGEHERWDGTGYPDGLQGQEIPMASRIVFVCDAWDAMTSDRPYRRRMPRDEAIAELAASAGSQFCPDCVQAFFTVLSRT